MAVKITNVIVRDIRFPTSRTLDGSDAVNVDPDYSATYITLETDDPGGLRGYGLTFTNGRGNEVSVAAVQALKHHVLRRTLESITEDFAGFWLRITSDSQVRWLGPEKGVIHLAAGALVNAVWDLYARSEHKPVWKLLVDMSPEQLVSCIPFRHITDALTPAEAIDILRRNASTKCEREQERREIGYPAYTTSAGWLGYSAEQVRQLLQANAISFCQIDSCRLAGVNEVLAVILMAAKFGVPVCPHAGGVGLCEYVQHLSLFDYIAVSASLENRITEYVDHLHEHFVYPVTMRQGRYLAPLDAGYSIEMKPKSLDYYEFPGGEAWRK